LANPLILVKKKPPFAVAASGMVVIQGMTRLERIGLQTFIAMVALAIAAFVMVN
jgi:hypothetical protein